MFDFSGVDPHWGPTPEASQVVNAGHLVPTYIEPFLIKVMHRAKPYLDPVRDAELIADIDIFNKQEGQHFKLHGGCMTMLRENGYAGMAEIEAAYAADYERFLKTKSLRWLLAYCDGFEATGSAIATTWIDGEMESGLAPADRRGYEIWRWHLAEEFEHRTVVFRTYHRLYGKPAVRAYVYRALMYIYSAAHIGRHATRLQNYLLSVDRAGMSPQELKQSKARKKAAPNAVSGWRNIMRLLRPLSPFYDPGKLPIPQNYEAVLSLYS